MILLLTILIIVSNIGCHKPKYHAEDCVSEDLSDEFKTKFWKRKIKKVGVEYYLMYDDWTSPINYMDDSSVKIPCDKNVNYE